MTTVKSSLGNEYHTPFLVMSNSQIQFEIWRDEAGFKPTEVKRVRLRKDMYGHKDTLLFNGPINPQGPPTDIFGIVDYADKHNIKRIRV